MSFRFSFLLVFLFVVFNDPLQPLVLLLAAATCRKPALSQALCSRSPHPHPPPDSANRLLDLVANLLGGVSWQIKSPAEPC